MNQTTYRIPLTKVIPYAVCGRIQAISDGELAAYLPLASVGEVYRVFKDATTYITAIVVSVQPHQSILLPLQPSAELRVGAKIELHQRSLCIPVPPEQGLLVSGAFADPDSTETGPSCGIHEIHAPTLDDRRPITQRFITGIRHIDALHPIGQGQRVAIVAPPGCGKSTLLKLLARSPSYDALVVGLIGERGREASELIDYFGNVTRPTTVVVEPSDAPSYQRALAAHTATAIAEQYRDRGYRVLLLIDSVTRMARATREMGLIRGERIVRGGYTHSVYTELPKLFERAGVTDKGSITAFYTVLCADERDVDPLREEIISLVDGHILLDQNLASRNLYPAIAPLKSLSRIGGSLMSEEQKKLKTQFVGAWTRLERDRDIALFGGKPDAELKRILACEPKMLSFLTQSEDENIPVGESLASLRRVIQSLNEA